MRGAEGISTSKPARIVILVIAQIGVLSLWFVSAAVLPEMQVERPMSDFRQAAL